MDLEKFAEAFAKRGLVPTIHIHEGSQIHGNQIDKFYLSGEGGCEPATVRGAEPAEATHLQDRLFYELGSDLERYNTLCRTLNMCVRPCDLSLYVRPLLKGRDGYIQRRYFTAAFAELFIPHLTKYQGKLSGKCLIRNL